MLKKIVDKNQLKQNEVVNLDNCLEIDLRRIDLLKHKNKPFFINAFKITPKNGVFMDSINYEFQYGIELFNRFIPLRKSFYMGHETLPYLSN